MIEFFAAVQAFLGVIIQLGRLSGRRLVQPVLTAVCLTGAYTAIHVGQEGSLADGVRSAFLENESSRLERHRHDDVTAMQMELRQFAAANKLINQILETTLSRASGASRVRLSVIHNGVTGVTGTGLLRYDVTNSVAAPGRSTGTAITNQPLSDWSDFLPTLLQGDCSFHRVDDLLSLPMRARNEAFGISSMLVCPAADVEGKTVGAIFVTWDGNDQPPEPQRLKELMAFSKHQGAQIAAILDLRAASPVYVPPNTSE
jgi:hypothetical protein